MKLNLSKTEEQKIKEVLCNNKITYGHQYYWESKRTIDRIETIEDFYFDKDKKQWTVKTNSSTLSLRDLLSYIYSGKSYKSQSKKIKDLAASYVKCNKNNTPEEFHKFLDDLNEGHFTITDVKILDDEIEWLKNHVTNITARFPRKYEKNFLRNFPNAEYTISDNSWNYGFTMYFDDLSEIPNSLLQLKNREGNSLDFDKKLMRNTSYIWKLVRNYSEFNFGKRCIN